MITIFVNQAKKEDILRAKIGERAKKRDGCTVVTERGVSGSYKLRDRRGGERLPRSPRPEVQRCTT